MKHSLPSPHVVVIGAGHAAGVLVSQLRQKGHQGPITLVGDEALPPYQRPPLSKDYLRGDAGPERLWLKPQPYYAEQGVRLLAGTTALAVDTRARTVSLSDGQALGYDELVLATGARARPLPQAVLRGRPEVASLRTVADVDHLRQRLRPGMQVLVIGGGYIGLEAAAALRALQFKVTLIEGADRLLARSASPVVSEHLLRLHARHGVNIRLRTRLARLQADEGHVAIADFENGDVAYADLVLAGIGAEPNVALAQQAGLVCADGIVVDEDALSSDPHVHAIGDCSQRPLPRCGQRLRMESVQSAVEQARLAACHLLGLPRPPAELPWFWSDQHGHRLQTAGLIAGADHSVVRGDPVQGPFAVYHFQGETLLGVEALDAPQDFLFGKQQAGRVWQAAQLAGLRDQACELKALASVA